MASSDSRGTPSSNADSGVPPCPSRAATAAHARLRMLCATRDTHRAAPMAASVQGYPLAGAQTLDGLKRPKGDSSARELDAIAYMPGGRRPAHDCVGDKTRAIGTDLAARH